MSSTTLRLRQGCWIALLAMLALTLAPTLSHALASARGTPDWVEVCTSRGAQRLSADKQDGDHEGPRSTAAHLEPCAYCSLAGHASALPPGLAAGLSLPLAGTAPRPSGLQAPRPPNAWRSALPRAPPALI